MAIITTGSLFSHQMFRELVLDPMFKASTTLTAVRRIDTDSTVCYLPRVHPGSVAWTAEGAEIADSGLTADMIAVVPRKLAGLVVTSNESLEDANAAGILGQALALQLASAVDAAFFAAGGGLAPTGLAGVDGIPEVTAGTGNGLDDYAEAIGVLEAAGARPTVIFLSPGRWTSLLQTKAETGSLVPLLSGQVGPTGETQRSIFGVPVVVSHGVPDNDTAYVIDGSRVAVVVRRDGTVEADRSARFTSDSTVVRATLRLAFATPYATAVVRIAAA
jgi:HK97 family phage major capsid protein